MMTRLLRSPLVHFLALGGALLALRVWWEPDRPERSRIVIPAAEIARLRDGWTREHGSPPAPAAADALLRAAIDEEMLYREALARGFDRRDEAVRERLVRLAGFVGEETTADREALEREARALGLERGDLVVRRHLAQMMRLAAGRIGAEAMPSEDELAAYLARHAEEFALPDRIRLTHVYLSEEARGGGAMRDAVALIGTLGNAGPGAGAGRGDAFIRGQTFDGSAEALARAYGPAFAAAVGELPLRTWAGPVRSTWGVHLVWVETREAAKPPALADVRGRVLHRLLRERSAGQEREAMEAMRARYDVEIEQGDDDGRRLSR